MSNKRKSEDFGEQSNDYDETTSSNEWVSTFTATKPANPINEVNESITEKKIRKVIVATLDEEIAYKKYELEKINEVKILKRIFEAQNMLDKLRVCIICNFYSQNGRLSQLEYVNHPAIRSLKCEHLEMAIAHARALADPTSNSAAASNNPNSDTLCQELISGTVEPVATMPSVQYDVKICVGNVSKFICAETDTKQPPTYKWMVYIRSQQCSRLENYIKKVIFFLHASYKPDDIVEIKSPPFELTRRGWGEFPVQVQIHFKDARNKRVDVLHPIKLDWTQTGLQTFGGETNVQAKLILKPSDYVIGETSVKSNPTSSIPQVQPSSSESNVNSKCVMPAVDNSLNVAAQTQLTAANAEKPLDLSLPSDNDSKICLTGETPKTDQTTSCHLSTSSSIPDDKPSLNRSLPDDCLSATSIVKPIPSAISKTLNTAGFKMPSVVFPATKPAEVIYKIQPSDALIKPSNNSFLNSLKPAHQVCDTSVVKTTPALIANTTIKRIKLSTDQLTKIKSSSSSSPPTTVLKIEPEMRPVIKTELNEEEARPQDERVEDKSDYVSQESTDLLVYTLERLNDLTYPGPASFETVLRRLVAKYPLVGTKASTSMREYYSWPFGKRKAREWMWAVKLREMCTTGENLNLTGEIWTTKQVVLWLRAHGYAPLEYKHMIDLEFSSEQRETQASKSVRSDDDFSYVRSFSSISHLFDYKRFRSARVESNDSLMVEGIDVVTPAAESGVLNETKRRATLAESIAREKNPNENRFGLLELTTGEKWIREELFKLQIKSNTVNLIPSCENPKKPSISSLIPCPLVEMFLLAAFKRFAQDLIRQSCADLFLVPTTQSTDLQQQQQQNENVNSRRILNNQATTIAVSSNQQQRNVALSDQKFPLRLNVKDVYKTIMRHDRYDFLTNKYMGVYVESEKAGASLSNGSKLGQTGRACKLKKNFSESSLLNK